MDHSVFVNRTINMKKIKYIGLDMDHTLIRYHTKRFETLVYEFVVDYLIQHKQYPPEIKQFSFNFEAAIRGSVVDSKNGNILKLNRYGAIRKSYHGTQLIQYNEQKQIYRSTYVDLSDDNYIAIDTSFSIAFCVLFGQLIGFKDKYPGSLPSYETIAFDVLYSVDQVHAAGDLKRYIGEHLEEFVIQDIHVVKGLKRYIEHGKKFFILTNSDYAYSKLLLDYAINPFLDEGQNWQDIFEYVITLSAKPRFFYDKLRFLNVNAADGHMTNLHGPIVPGIYQGGNAKQFTDDLQLQGDEILYIGDHIYGDILRLKKDCNWRTALVVEELGTEIQAQTQALPIEEDIMHQMMQKETLEHQYVELQSQTFHHKTPEDRLSLQALHEQIIHIDTQVSALIEQQEAFFNPTWGRVFRAGAEESYFAYQVERYACVYMEKLTDLLNLSPYHYFRAHKRMLAHDLI
ncbi:MAG: 5'-nucleotidase [Legionella sp.]|nr:MAG: 5'-nucleotidase [Legionella sp.]